MSTSYVRGLHMMMHNCLNRAVKERLILRNPTEDCIVPKIEKQEMKILKPEDIGAYLREADRRGVMAMFYLDGFLSAVRSISEHFSGQFAGVAVSLPGSVDTANGVARTVGALAYISNTPLATLLQDCLGVPATIANDAYCAASAEAWNGALSDVNSGCVVVWGTGIGGGIVLDGKVWMGQSFSAGQFSALPADFDGIYQGVSAPDSPGLYSFWTGLVSASGLLHSYAVRKGLSPTGRGLDGVQFFAAYDAGEPETVETLQAFGKQAAAGIYAIQSVLDVQRFAIGGGISARPEVTAIIRESLKRLFSLLPFTPFPCPEIVTCRYGNDANLIGALRFYLENKR